MPGGWGWAARAKVGAAAEGCWKLHDTRTMRAEKQHTPEQDCECVEAGAYSDRVLACRDSLKMKIWLRMVSVRRGAMRV